MTLRLLAVLVFAACGPAAAQSIEIATYGKVADKAPHHIDFDDPYVHIRQSGPQSIGGATFGEGFAGLGVEGVTSQSGARFDVATTSQAEGPLTATAGPPLFNLEIEFREPPRNRVLLPVGPVGLGRDGGVGEGALSILFDTDQCAFGAIIELDGDDPVERIADSTRVAHVEIWFFSRDGKRMHVAAVRRVSAFAWYQLAWRQTGGTEPRIAGVYIQNLDNSGIAIDDIVFRDDCTPLVG